jgi:hypothetical protein
MKETEMDGYLGKQAFVSGTVAMRVLRRGHSREKSKLQVYRCEHCGGYHIGNSARRDDD